MQGPEDKRSEALLRVVVMMDTAARFSLRSRPFRGRLGFPVEFETQLTSLRQRRYFSSTSSFISRRNVDCEHLLYGPWLEGWKMAFRKTFFVLRGIVFLSSPVTFD